MRGSVVLAVALIASVLVACGETDPTPTGTAAVTPMPTATTVDPTRSVAPPPAFPDDAIVEIRPDGTTIVTTLAGVVLFVGRIEDIAPSGGRFTGVAGVVVDGAGYPVAGALISTRRPENGNSCRAFESAYLSGPAGSFRVPLPPGMCVVAADRNGRRGPGVLVEIVQDHVTPITLVAP